MDKSNYIIITDAVNEFLKENAYKLTADGELEYFTNGENAVSIFYDDTSSQLMLRLAALKEGEGVEWKVLSSWLFDDKLNDRDKKSIANDFIDSLKESFGIKPTTSRNTDVALPTKTSNSDNMDIETFAAKFLAVYPQLKDAYKSNIADYGEFLYDEFFKVYGVEMLKSALTSGTKKQIDKLMDLLSNAYINGDTVVTTTIIYTIMAGTLLDNPQLANKAYEYMEKRDYLKRATVTMLNLLTKPSSRKKYL